MAPLIILFSTFAIVFLLDRFLLNCKLGTAFAGRAGMSAMLILISVSHFTNPELMVTMMPDIVPAKTEVVYLTGILEFAAAVGLLWERTARVAAILLIVFFVAVLPANIVGSFKRVPLAGMDYGPWYLLFRVPLQIFFMWWVYYFGIRKPKLGANPNNVKR